MRQLRQLLARVQGRRQPTDDPVSVALTRHLEGVADAEAGRFKRAVDSFTAALELAASPPPGIFHHRASALAELGRHREAISDYDTAIRLNPGYPDTYLDRGNSYHALGEHSKAIKDYSEAIRLRPDYAEAYANRAAVHAETGDDEARREDAERARALGVDVEALDALLEQARKAQKK